MDQIAETSLVVEASPETKIALGQIEDLLARLHRTAKAGSVQRAGLDSLRRALEPLLRPRQVPPPAKPKMPPVGLLAELRAVLGRYAEEDATPTKTRQEIAAEIDAAWAQHTHAAE